MANEYLELVRSQFNNRVSFVERRPGIFQFIAPIYHEDGDMYDVFVEGRWFREGQGPYQRSWPHTDATLIFPGHRHGNRERILNQIISEHGIVNDGGNLVLTTTSESLYQGLLQFTRAVTAITNMRLYRREVIRSLFYEMFPNSPKPISRHSRLRRHSIPFLRERNTRWIISFQAQRDRSISMRSRMR